MKYEKRKVYQRGITTNNLTVHVEHNGVHPVNPNFKGYVTIKLKYEGCNSMEVNGKEAESVEITLRGKTERETLIKGLKVILRELYGPISDLNGPISDAWGPMPCLES